MQVTVCLEMSEAICFLAPNESEEKKCIDVMLRQITLWCWCNAAMMRWKGCAGEIVMIGVPLQIILDVMITSSTPQLRKSGDEERGETAKSAYWFTWPSFKDKQSANEKARGMTDVRVPAWLGLSRRKGGRGASAKPMPMSNNLRPRLSRGEAVTSGVDSKEEDDDSRLWCRCVGVCGVIDRPENCSVGGKLC